MVREKRPVMFTRHVEIEDIRCKIHSFFKNPYETLETFNFFVYKRMGTYRQRNENGNREDSFSKFGPPNCMLQPEPLLDLADKRRGDLYFKNRIGFHFEKTKKK